MIAAAIPAAGAGMALSVMAQAIKELYGMAKEVNEWLDEHIASMKDSENPTVSRTGRILEGAKCGFAIGYITPVIVISAGQLLLGNPLGAVNTVGTALALSNPIAMTCAATGAIYYGWCVLSDVERQEILDKLSKGLDVGVELIKSIVSFVIDKTKELMSSDNFKEMKQFVSDAASVFGKTLGDVTRKVSDVFGDTIDAITKKSGEALDKTTELASTIVGAAKETAGKAVDSAKEVVENLKPKGDTKPDKLPLQ